MPGANFKPNYYLFILYSLIALVFGYNLHRKIINYWFISSNVAGSHGTLVMGGGAPTRRAHEEDVTPKLGVSGKAPAGPTSQSSLKRLHLDRVGRRVVKRRRQRVPRHRQRRCCFGEIAKQFGMARPLLGAGN